jgi:putative addiction module CopG family antidote
MNQAINVSLPKSLTELAREQVKAGYYSSVSEVIRSALRQLLLKPQLPVYPLSERAEEIGLQALSEHKRGKTLQVSSFKDLEG